MKETLRMVDVHYSDRAESLKRGKYRHYKGKMYEVVDVAVHSETLEELVVYKPLYDNPVGLWVRPLAMFLEEVEVDGVTVPRFEFIG